MARVLSAAPPGGGRDIVLASAAPALDRYLRVRAWHTDSPMRPAAVRVLAGGKAANAARAARIAGLTPHVVALGGGLGAAEFAQRADCEGLDVVLVDVGADIRTCTCIAGDDGTFAELYEPVAPVGPDAADALVATLGEVVGRTHPGWVAISGRLAPGMAHGTWARIVAQAHQRGHPVAIDADGAGLAAAIQAGPDLVKVNAQEAGDLLGCQVRTREAAASAAKDLCRLGAATAIITMGPAGAVGASGDALVAAGGAPVARPMAVGAGDAFFAGVLAALADVRHSPGHGPAAQGRNPHLLGGEQLEAAMTLGSALARATAATLVPADFGWQQVLDAAENIRIQRPHPHS